MIDTEQKIFENRAEVTVTERINCENCFEELIFALEDNYHEFSLGLSTVLECLKTAEQVGCVPKLPDGWWLKTQSNYHEGVTDELLQAENKNT